MLAVAADQKCIPKKLLKSKPHDPKSKSRNIPKLFLDALVHYQAETALALIITTWSLYLSHPSSRVLTSKFIYLSYRSPLGTTYRQGFDDLYFVLAWIVNFTALRAICIDRLLRPLASRLGIHKYKLRLRFAEQSWLIVYYVTFWVIGMYIWATSNYWLDNSAVWETWPTRDMDRTLKWYCLVQLAFWLQQVLVIHMEARRRDYAQMLTHHVLTCFLMTSMYIYRFTKVGNVVLCLMDVVDFLLPIAKILQYLGYETSCHIAFAVFIITWIVARHILYPKLCMDIFRDIPGPNTIAYGCYSGVSSELLPEIPAQPNYVSHLFWPLWDQNGTICINEEIKWIFLLMLLVIQILSIIWFGMIAKILIKLVMGGEVKDTRSDVDCDVG